MSLERFSFGSGAVFGYSSGGNQVSNPTPIQLGTVQDATVDIATTVKELKGRNQFPDDVAPADRKVTGKVKFAQNSAIAIGNLLEGVTPTAGRERLALNEAGTIPAATPWTVTVTNSTTFTQDLGVQYAATGLPLTKVTSGPIAGEYSEAAGVYTFAAADTGAAVLISYTWSDAATGTTVTVLNQLQGYGPVVSLYLAQPYSGDSKDMKVYAARVTKWTRDQKQGDYNVIEMDFEAYANPAGQVYAFMEG